MTSRVITRAVRHREWARFVLFGWSTSDLYADWLACRQQSRSLLVVEVQITSVQVAKNEMCAFLA